MKWYLRACPVCSGDLHEDIEDRGWVSCFMCGRSYKASEMSAVRESDAAVAAAQPRVALQSAA